MFSKMKKVVYSIKILPIFFILFLIMFSCIIPSFKKSRKEDRKKQEMQKVVLTRNQNNNKYVVSWLTSDDGSKRVEKQPDLILQDGNSSLQDKIIIDPSITYQQIDGIGFALTQESALAISSLDDDVEKNLLHELFGEDGLNISALRLPIGASDLSTSIYFYSQGPDHFSLNGPDLDYVIPMVKQILHINPDIKIMGTPWSAPPWMKDNNSPTAGFLKKENYPDYADYFVKYIKEMQNHGIDIWALTVQNEPLNGNNTPSMIMSAEDQYDFIQNYLGPAFDREGINTLILGYDHNCDVTGYPIHVAGSEYVDGSAFHLYAGDISAMGDVYNTTGKDVYFTEQWTGGTDREEFINGFGVDLGWHMKNVIIGAFNNWAKTVFEWNLANDLSIYNDEVKCFGAVEIQNTRTYVRYQSYAIVGQVTKIVKPGAVRIASSISPNNFKNTAFKNEDGSYSIIIYNNDGADRNVSVEIGGKYFIASIPAWSVKSFLWNNEK